MTSENQNTKTENNMTCGLAESREDREAVYRLRYSCYRRKNSIPESADESFSDSYDALPNHFSILARSGGEVHGTVRISVVRPDLGWNTAPSHKVFGDHPAFQAIAESSFVEASRLCFGLQARRDALMRVVSYLAALADFYEVEWLVACPRVEHTHVYERLFGFAQIGEPRQYFGVTFETSLLAVRREDLRRYVEGCRPMEQARDAALAQLVAAASASSAPAAKPELGRHCNSHRTASRELAIGRSPASLSFHARQVRAMRAAE